MFNRTTIEELQTLFGYDPETGDVWWKVNRPSKGAGEIAGTTSTNGQRFVRLRGECIMTSHIAWALSHGERPTGQIIHINGKQNDDRIVNLQMLGQGVLTEDLYKIISYDPVTGEFTWKINYGKKIKAGAIAGGIDAHKGYREIRVGFQLVRAHRLAVLLMTGKWPEAQVDHINGDRADNRWENLRLASAKENVQNTGIRTDNTSGRKGVHFNKNLDRWTAYINVNGKRIVKYTASFEHACELRSKLETDLHSYKSLDEGRPSFKRAKMIEISLDDI